MAKTKTERRWAFRVALDDDVLVREAADLMQRTLTDFVRQAAVVEAARVLGDRTRFVLSAEAWARFSDHLERAPQENPGLEKLFAKPTVFE